MIPESEINEETLVVYNVGTNVRFLNDLIVSLSCLLHAVMIRKIRAVKMIALMDLEICTLCFNVCIVINYLSPAPERVGLSDFIIIGVTGVPYK